MTGAMNDLGQITVWGQVNGDRAVLDVNDVSGVDLDVNDVKGVVSYVVSDVNDVSDANGRRFDLYRFGGWNVLDVDLGQPLVWTQGNDDFGHRFDQCFQLKLVCLVECQGFGALLACPLTLELCLGCRVKLLCLFPASPDHLFLVSFQLRGLLPLTVLQHQSCHSGDGGQWHQDAFQMYVVPPFFEVSLVTG